MMPLTAIILIKARLLERLLAIIGSLKILIIKFFTQNGKNPTEGRSTIVYTITAFCVECLITRKER